MNKKIWKKITSGILSLSILTYSATPVLAYTKDESVYTKLDNSGNVYQTIVSDHLKNTEKSELLEDISDLMNIKNVSGNQQVEEDNGKLIWKAQGEDIYYEGNTDKELPIECKITYELDGQKISKEDIIGKSGLVKINLEFVNKEKRYVTINGKTEILYVPFVVGIGTFITNENNNNIKISNGKVIDNGNKTMIFGIALPGMQESLGINENVLEIPNRLEISMEATEFEMNDIYCFATPKLIEENDLKLFNKMDKVYSMTNQLKDGANRLVEGSAKLADGANKLNDGTDRLSKELNAEILKYENAKKKLVNKKELEEKIIDILNKELNNLMPELQALAEEEAKNVIKENLKGEKGIEEKTVQTALAYSKLAINSKLNELKNDSTENKIQGEILNQIENDIIIALKNVESKQDVQNIENTIKNLILNDITSTVKETTDAVVANKVEMMKESITNPTTLLTTSEKETLSKSQNEIAKAMVPGIKADAASKGVTLTDEEAFENALSSVNGLVTAVSKNTMDKTLEQVKNQAPTMAENTVNEIASKLNTNEAIHKAIINYENKIVTEIKMQVGEETLIAIKNNIKNEIVEEVKKTFENDKTLQREVISKLNNEINPTIDSIAEQTAQKLAEDFTEDLANQIASNLIKKQLNGELSNTEINKELSKYENLINSKLWEVDEKLKTLKYSLVQLTDGTRELANGATELQNGMSKFDEEGIQKIYNIVNNNVKNLQTRVEKLKELSNEYNSFSNIADDIKGNVKFIMIIDSLKKEEADKEQAILPEEIKEKNN